MDNLLIVGTIFVDCKAYATEDYNPYGRNVGNIKFIHGGVGRNVAENLASLGFKVNFASTVETTPIGNEVMAHLKEQKVDTKYVKAVEKGGMGIWSVIMDQNGAQLGAVSQMPDMGILEEHIKSNCKKMIRENDAVLLEIDLSPSISEMIINEANAQNKPVYALPGNMQVVLARQDLLSKLACFVCNDIEAGRIFDLDASKISDEELLEKALYYGEFKGINSMVITQGERGCVYYNLESGEKGSLPSIKTKVVDSTGAGDAFFSGLVAALVRNSTLKKAAETGTTMASLTIRVEQNTFAGIEVGI